MSSAVATADVPLEEDEQFETNAPDRERRRNRRRATIRRHQLRTKSAQFLTFRVQRIARSTDQPHKVRGFGELHDRATKARRRAHLPVEFGRQ